MSEYEFWLTDDSGRRISLLRNFAYASYSRTSRGLGTVLFGIPFETLHNIVPDIFQVDWRLDIYRSPAKGYSKRREGSFLLRKLRIYDRAGDSVRMVEFFGRSPLDLLMRMIVDADSYTGTIDDIMKDIVSASYLDVAPSASEFTIDADTSLGPSITLKGCQGKNVRDVLTDLKNTSLSLYKDDPTNKKIYFDVVEGANANNGFGYVFRTYSDLRGTDRTNTLVFSPENGNLKEPEYIENYLEELTIVTVNSQTVTGDDSNLSRWNRRYSYKTSVSTDAAANTSEANSILADRGKDISLRSFFLNTPGSDFQPRSLYGIDWDLGDLLSVQYAGKNISAEVEIVWVSLDDEGNENIVGSNKVGE